jgi:starch synthase
VYVVMVAAECAPAAKAGGLGDVVAGLSRELEIRGNAVEIILPKYASLRYSEIWGLAPSYENLWVPWYGGAVRCTVWFGYASGRKCFFIEPHSAANFFGRERMYGYWDDPERFAFFAKAAVEFMLHSGKRPDVVHCHDWQTGLVPVLIREQYGAALAEQRICYTIHNFRHQGAADDLVLWATQLGRPDYYLDADRLGDDFRYGGVNPMKGGIVYSDAVNTVSPNHADEALYGDGGFGLSRILKEHQVKFSGVLNGVDYEMWNPESDPLLPVHYSAETIERKKDAKAALRDRLLLRDSRGPLVAYVGRLDEQKGMHLVHHALFYTLARGGQFALVGDSHYHDGIKDHYWHLKGYLNDNPDCHLELAYEEQLAHLIYAGADLLLVPSMFEPCGLAPLIGMRYGTVPVVRATGGMVDTVFDRDHSQRPRAERNGYVFHHTDNNAIESALSRALRLWSARPGQFRDLAVNCMRADYSWALPGEEYMEIYKSLSGTNRALSPGHTDPMERTGPAEAGRASGWIVVLNGAPRAGKSSIARVIQDTFDRPWMSLGADVFSQHVTPRRYRPGMGLRPGGERLDSEALIPALYAAFYDSVAAHSRHGTVRRRGRRASRRLLGAARHARRRGAAAARAARAARRRPLPGRGDHGEARRRRAWPRRPVPDKRPRRPRS